MKTQKQPDLNKFKAYSHWVAGQHGVALILLFLWRAFAGVPKVSKAKTCEIHVKSNSPCSTETNMALTRCDSATWLQAIKTPAPVLHGRAPFSRFLLVWKNFNALCTFTYQSDQYDLIVIHSLCSCN